MNALLDIRGAVFEIHRVLLEELEERIAYHQAKLEEERAAKEAG
jgi:hypothetical protein